MSKKNQVKEEELQETNLKKPAQEAALPADADVQPEAQEKTEAQATLSAEETLAEKPAETPDYYAQFVRLSADFDNYRKRTEREKVSFLTYGKKQFAQQMLPAYEVLLRQQEQMDAKKEVGDCAAEIKTLHSGIKMIVTELDKAFKTEGIVRMAVLDKPYDPATQEVVAMLPSAKEQDGLVLQEVQMGFMMDGQVLRPARVIVGQHSEK